MAIVCKDKFTITLHLPATFLGVTSIWLVMTPVDSPGGRGPSIRPSPHCEVKKLESTSALSVADVMTGTEEFVSG